MIQTLGFYLRHSLNDLRVNGTRTIYAILCIAAGVAAVVSLQTLGVIIGDTLTGSLQETYRADIRVYANGMNSVANDEIEALVQQGVDDGVIRSEEESIPGAAITFDVRYFYPDNIAVLQAWFDENFPDQVTLTYRVLGPGLGGFDFNGGVTNPETGTFASFASMQIVDTDVYPLYGVIADADGTLLSELINAPDEIVISQNLADLLEVEVGAVVRINGANQDFRVTGIVPTDTEGGFSQTALLGSQFGYYYLDIDAVQYFEGLEARTDMLYLRLSDPSRVPEIRDALRERFPYLRIDTTEELLRRNQTISDSITQLVTVMGLVSMLIGGIGIINTMQVIVRRRTLEVAVLKTLGMDANQVTRLFLVEAFIMGVIGSLVGIVLGYLATYAIKGAAEVFLGRTLLVRVAAGPIITGLVLGVLVTTIFGFLPTLSAGRVRPGIVLRPNDNLIPRAGFFQSFVALLLMIMALSVVAQGVLGGFGIPQAEPQEQTIDAGGFGSGGITVTVENDSGLELPPDLGNLIGASLGMVAGLILGVSALLGGLWAGWTRGNSGLKLVRFLLLLLGVPVALYFFGYFVPALAVLMLTFMFIGLLYVLLLGTIWLVGRFFPSFGVADVKVSLRSMLAARGRGAVTLLALAVGVFSLSLITLQAVAINQVFESVLINQAGGNVYIAVTGLLGGTLENVEARFENVDGINSYTAVKQYGVRLVEVQDGATGVIETREQLNDKLPDSFNRGGFEFLDALFGTIDARDPTSNLPNMVFVDGRQLTPEDVGQNVIVVAYTPFMGELGIGVGDTLTFELTGSTSLFNRTPARLSLQIVGMVDPNQNFSIANSTIYAPLTVFPENVPPTVTNIIMDIDEENIPQLRRELSSLPTVFVLEVKLLNDILNRLLSQFTTFPIVVALLGLVVGGVVIANSVALTTMERRKDIAVMKAVGLQRSRVLGMLLLENALMGFIGGLIGVGLGLVMLGLLFGSLAALGGGGGIVLPVGHALLLMLLCLVIGVLAAISAAWNASGEKPLNVLRYE